MCNLIVFDDNELRAVWHQGTSDFLLVTFGDLISLADGSRFWADKAVRRLDLTCLGLMAKGPNWYPASSVQPALMAVERRLELYSERVLYGSSMGGYAAVKYSQSFQATAVIALSPQWSIEESACDGIDPGWPTYFTPAMVGMEIQSKDVSGNVSLFVDRAFHPDGFHEERIRDAYPRAITIAMPHCRHEVAPLLAGTERLDQIIRAARRNDVARLRAIAREARQTAQRRQKLLERAVRSMPRLATRIAVAGRRDPCVQAVLARSGPALLASPQVLDEPALREKLMAALMESAPDLKTGLPFLHLRACQQGGVVRISTCWGTWIAYDWRTNSAVHLPPSENKQTNQVELWIDGQKATLMVILPGLKTSLARDPLGKLTLSPGLPAENSVWDIENVAGAMFSLRQGQNFLCAEPSCLLAANRLTRSTWESFSLALT